MKFINYIVLSLMTVVLVSCEGKSAQNYITIDGFAEGTTFHIIYYDPQERDLSDNFAQFFDDFDNSLSIYNPSSLVSRMNANDTTVYADNWFEECFNLSRTINHKSEGLFDPTLAPLISAYGFAAEGGMRKLSQKQLDSMLSFVGYDKVQLNNRKLVKQDSRIKLDFNAIAKGYSVDLLGQMLDSLGINNYMVEVGGEIVCKGKTAKGKDWTVGIDNPKEGNYMPGADLKAIIAVSGCGLATSGNYRKFATDEDGNIVVHTIDPRTGKPSIHNLLSATIIAPTCAVADGYATACMVAGLDKARQIVAANADLEAMFIYAEDDKMLIESTPGMKKRIIESK